MIGRSKQSDHCYDSECLGRVSTSYSGQCSACQKKHRSKWSTLGTTRRVLMNVTRRHVIIVTFISGLLLLLFTPRLPPPPPAILSTKWVSLSLKGQKSIYDNIVAVVYTLHTLLEDKKNKFCEQQQWQKRMLQKCTSRTPFSPFIIQWVSGI